MATRQLIVGVLAMILTCESLAQAQARPYGNGDAVTEEEIEQRTKLDFLSTHKQAARQDVINELIDDKDKITQANRLLLDLSDTQVDSVYAEMPSRMHLTPDQLATRLEAQGIRIATLKSRIKADMARARLARMGQ